MRGEHPSGENDPQAASPLPAQDVSSPIMPHQFTNLKVQFNFYRVFKEPIINFLFLPTKGRHLAHGHV
jgi:hypothetical protein